MKKSSFYIPPGYVATRCELVFIFLGCLVMFGVGLMMWDTLVDIPPVPKKLVLRSAYVTHSLGGSKSSAYLYFNVEQGEGGYKYMIEFPSRESGLLDIYKHKKLWVAADSDGRSEFVWAVYDDEFRLMMSRQQIEQWVRVNNVRGYIMVACSCLTISYFIFLIVRSGVYNRYCNKKVVSENREG